MEETAQSSSKLAEGGEKPAGIRSARQRRAQRLNRQHALLVTKATASGTNVITNSTIDDNVAPKSGTTSASTCTSANLTTSSIANVTNSPTSISASTTAPIHLGPAGMTSVKHPLHFLMPWTTDGPDPDQSPIIDWEIVPRREKLRAIEVGRQISKAMDAASVTKTTDTISSDAEDALADGKTALVTNVKPFATSYHTEHSAALGMDHYHPLVKRPLAVLSSFRPRRTSGQGFDTRRLWARPEEPPQQKIDWKKVPRSERLKAIDEGKKLIEKLYGPREQRKSETGVTPDSNQLTPESIQVKETLKTCEGEVKIAKGKLEASESTVEYLRLRLDAAEKLLLKQCAETKQLLHTCCIVTDRFEVSKVEDMTHLLLEKWSAKTVESSDFRLGMEKAEEERKRLEKELGVARRKMERVERERKEADANLKDLVAAVKEVTGTSARLSPENAGKVIRESWASLTNNYADVSKKYTDVSEKYNSTVNELQPQLYLANEKISILTKPLEEILEVDPDQFEAQDLADNLSMAWERVQTNQDQLKISLEKSDREIRTLEAKSRILADCIKDSARELNIHFEESTPMREIVTMILKAYYNVTARMTSQGDEFREMKLMSDQEIESRNFEIKALRAEVTRVTEQMHILSGKKKGIFKKLRKNNKVQPFMGTPNSAASNIRQLQETIKSLNAEKSSLESRLNNLSREKEEDERLLRRTRSARDGLKLRVKALNFDNDRLTENIDQLYRLVAELQNRHHSIPPGALHSTTVVNDSVVLDKLTATCQSMTIDDVSPFYQDAKFPETLKWLATGNYSEVTMARLKDSSAAIVVKKQSLPKGLVPSEAAAEREINNFRARKEMAIQQAVSGCASFPRFYGTLTMEDDLCIAMEFIGEKNYGKVYSLKQILEKTLKNVVLTRVDMLEVAIDITNGLIVLHDKGLLHNDLHNGNVLLQPRRGRWQGVIIDFGLASSIALPFRRKVSKDVKAEYKAGKIYSHMAPEVILQEHPTSILSDIFSLGMIFKDMGKTASMFELRRMGEECTKYETIYRPDSLQKLLASLKKAKSRLWKDWGEDGGEEEEEEVVKEGCGDVPDDCHLEEWDDDLSLNDISESWASFA
ncbi:uncharacterized protein [Diadema setosum]|uniref:uncharacterized protein n=1 Tax=Diadema setosum TaxID=31175 RepID=UPI003B3A0639